MIFRAIGGFVWVLIVTVAAAPEDSCSLSQGALVSATMQRNASGHWSLDVELDQKTALKRVDPLRIDAEPMLKRCGSSVSHALRLTVTGRLYLFAEDYTELPGFGYYKYHPEKLSWGEAKKVCELEGAQLLVLNSVVEAGALSAYVKRQKDFSYAFIGTHDSGNGNWLTISGEKLVDAGYAVWMSGEHDTDPGGEDCGGVNVDMKLCDLGCSDQKPFICEYP